ncbi:hypothetical protein Tco_1321139 [Tanacetum coccineum]
MTCATHPWGSGSLAKPLKCRNTRSKGDCVVKSESEHYDSIVLVVAFDECGSMCTQAMPWLLWNDDIGDGLRYVTTLRECSCTEETVCSGHQGFRNPAVRFSGVAGNLACLLLGVPPPDPPPDRNNGDGWGYWLIGSLGRGVRVSLEKLEEEEIEKMVEGEEDEESYASEFAYFMFNDDDDDFGTRIEPGSHKVNPEVVDDDEVNDKEKQDEKKDDDAEKMDDAAEKKDNDDHTYHTLVGTHATGSMETRKEQIQTLIPTPTRSPRKDLSLDKTIYEEFMANVSPTTASTSKVSSKSKSKRGFTSNKTKILPGSIIREVLDHYNNVVLEMTFAKTNEIIKEEMPRLVNLAVNKDREIATTNNPTLNLYPTTSSSTAETSTAFQHQLYLNMKSKPQDQAADPELWEILKAKGRKGRKAYEPYSIVDKLNTGLIYLNNKDEKRVTYLVEIVKFCDVTLERVLNEVKLRIFQNQFWKKTPRLGELDLDIMRAFEREISKRLSHR